MPLCSCPRSVVLVTIEDLIEEIERYLEVVDFFRSLGCEPSYCALAQMT
jgi:hypothetical protein